MNIKNSFFIIIIFSVIVFFSVKTKAEGERKEKIVLIKTEFGVMKAKLYNETPLHRDNFTKLANEGYYNNLLFHRVIKDFMIQGGDPNSRGASPDKRLGGGGPEYQIPAEILKTYFHKKGALCAARQGDNVNPEKKSSGSQFYIVQGKVCSNALLKQLEEKQKNQVIKNETIKLFNARHKEIQRLQTEGKTDSIDAIKQAIQKAAEQNVDSSQFCMSKDQHDIYTTIGGTPFLDGSYTVFGEVIEGLNIIDSIAKVQTAPGDRPLKDIKMTIEVLK